MGVSARGARAGVPARGCSVGASAAPCSADFDPPGRTAPAGRGPRAAPRPRRFPAGGRGHADHCLGGPGEEGTGPQPCGHVLFPRPSVGGVRVFVGALGVELACLAGGGGGGGLGAVTSTGRRPGASEAGPAAGARSTAQLWSALGNFCPPPAGPVFCEFWGFPSSSHPGPQRLAGWGEGACCCPPPHFPHKPRAGPPAPPPRSRSLRKLRP